MAAEPRYNIRAVEHLTGVPAPTLRSWERRYGFPLPARTLTARRLYSDDDVRAIRWVRQQTGHGLSVAQAIEWAQDGGRNGDGSNLTGMAVTPVRSLIQALMAAVGRYDEEGVETALATAFAQYPADQVLLDILTPALVEVGDAWARGDLPVAAEHFFSNLVRRRLLGLLAAQPAFTHRLTAALACLPGEQHELGLLMLALFLRWTGVRVLYLGADVPVRDLVRLVETRAIELLCLSGGTEAHWQQLTPLAERVTAAGKPVRIYVGGSGSESHDPPPGVQRLSGDLRAVVSEMVRPELTAL